MLDDLKEGARRNPIWFGAVATITGVQTFFAWEFWGAITSDPVHQLALRALGVGFVAGEVVALDMASRAQLANEPRRADALRALWLGLALTTFTADISALSRVLRDGDAARAEAVAAYDAQQSELQELNRQIDAADDPYDDALLSVAAYDAAIAGKQREITSARRDGARGSQRLRLEAELTDLQTARATAIDIAGWQERRAAILATPAIHAARPASGPAQFQPIAEMATGIARSTEQMLGRPPQAEVTAEDVRSTMAWVSTIAMKLMLTFGVWVGLQRTGAPRRNDEQPEDPAKRDGGTSDRDPPKGDPPPPRRPPAQSSSRRTAPKVFGRGGARFHR
jgi:hypothetical protein